MIITLDGDNGTGKTSYLAFLSTLIDKPIWSNFELPLHPYYSELDMYKIITLGKKGHRYESFPNGLVIFFDEAYTWLEARLSSRIENIYLSWKTNYQWRKRWLDVYLTFQDLASIDLRFRNPIRWDIQLVFEYRDVDSKDPFVVNYYRPKRNNKRRKKPYYRIIYPYEFMAKYFNHFNTREIVEPPNMAKIEWSLIKDNPDLKKLILNDIYDKIYPQVKNDYGGSISHPELKTLLTGNSYLTIYESDLYGMIKQKKKL